MEDNIETKFKAYVAYRTGDDLTKKKYRVLKHVLNYIFSMADVGGVDVAKPLVPIVESIEYSMQEVLGLPKDSKFHRYWREIPGCTCPYLDNEDAFGTVNRYYSEDCPYHGHKEKLQYTLKENDLIKYQDKDGVIISVDGNLIALLSNGDEIKINRDNECSFTVQSSMNDTCSDCHI